MILALVMAAALAASPERPSHAWELTGLYAFAAGADEAAGGWARARHGAAYREAHGLADFNGRMGLKLALAPVYVWSADRLLRSRSKGLRVAGRVLEVALPAVYLYGAVRNAREGLRAR